MTVRERTIGGEGQKLSPIEIIAHALRGKIEPVTSDEFGSGLKISGMGFSVEMFQQAHVVVANGGVQSTTLREVVHVSVRSGEVIFVAGNNGIDQRTLMIDRHGNTEILRGESSIRQGIIEEDPILCVHEGAGAKPGIVDAKFIIRTSGGDTLEIDVIGKESKLGRLRRGDNVILRGGQRDRIRKPNGEETDVFFARRIELRFAF